MAGYVALAIIILFLFIFLWCVIARMWGYFSTKGKIQAEKDYLDSNHKGEH